MDGGAWWAAVHGVARSRTRLSDFTLFFHFHALEKEMATHSIVLAWRIPGMAEPGGLPSMGSHRVGHNWSDLAAAAVFCDYGFSVSALWCPLATPTVLLGFLLPCHRVSLQDCSSKAQPLLLLTLDEEYLLRAVPSDLECGVVSLGPPAPMQPL